MPRAIRYAWDLTGTGAKPQHVGVYIRCPGCNANHYCSSQIHQFNGNVELPTFTPSLKQDYGDGTICHSYVTDGRINFLPDTNRHGLRGWHDLLEVPPDGR